MRALDGGLTGAGGRVAELILFNKPFRVLSQFTDDRGRATLADYIDAEEFYPAGRLDYDSEGLLLLCRDGGLQQRISDPRHKLPKTYLLQLDGAVDETALAMLREGVTLRDGLTRPARARRVDPPRLWERDPPVRYRAAVPTSWVEITIREGRNRQLRRMGAAVGFPVLRLLRTAVGGWRLDDLGPGEYRRETVNLPRSQRPTRARSAKLRGRREAPARRR